MIKFELDTHPVFYDIIEIFMAQGILYTSDCIDRNGIQQPIEATKESITLVDKYIDYFMLLSLQDHKLINTNQYLIACSITSACRKHCSLNPLWSQELIQLTGLQHNHFCNIEKRLLQKFEQ